MAPLALSAHIDAGEKDAVERLQRRLGFAARIGTRIVITNSTTLDRRDEFRRNVAELLPVAQECGVVIAFENPGHGTHNLIGSAADGVKLRAEFDSPWIGINYDTGNIFTYSEERLRPEADIEQVLAIATHFHLKDIMSTPAGWSFTAIGEGSIDFARICALLSANGNRIPVGIELPLRLRRAQHADPRRDKTPLPLDEFGTQSRDRCALSGRDSPRREGRGAPALNRRNVLPQGQCNPAACERRSRRRVAVRVRPGRDAASLS